MALVVPDEGELELLDKMLKDALTADESYILKLFKNDVTPTNVFSAGSLTEADFTSYAAKTLTRALWAVGVTNGSNKAETSYDAATPQSWTSGTTGNTIYGYYVVGASSTAVLWAERFATARVLSDGDVLNLNGGLGLAKAA